MPRNRENTDPLALGTCYLIHFSKPFGHARHYIGWSINPKKRLWHHSRNSRVKLLKAARAAGIKFRIVREWHAVDRHFERGLKAYASKYLCPICNPRSWDKRAKEPDPFGRE